MQESVRDAPKGHGVTSQTVQSGSLQEAVRAVLPEVVALRHHLHQHPELSGQEERTAAHVAERLRALKLDLVREGVGGFGIVAELQGGAGAGPVFALRADMDALPISEENDVPYRSCVPGVMHACGHDGHTAILYGVAAVLARLREQIPGTIRFLFQPAEENVTGAARMCAEGAMDGVGAIVALHGWPGLPVGQIGVRSGPMMASSDTFDLVVHGRGAHAAMPHVSVDPIVAGAQVVLALQTLVSREVPATEAAVVTVSQFHAGTTHNIIPETARIQGTVRCLSASLRAALPERIERVVAGVCGAMRARYTLNYHFGTGVTVNDPEVTTRLVEVGQEVLGASNVVVLDTPSMGAEDFSVYLEHAPGAMFRLGVGTDRPPLHTPWYDFGDEPLPIGIELLVRVALRSLNAAVAG
ncbi:MAG: amidohydrolase [Chloroherpetonaceae bacterium]|nr:amidohydrolase [Chthonomonadaceae bacterium]MDW8207691.1 amidohydrolase [Chloroherpetonaceae bacterium]